MRQISRCYELMSNIIIHNLGNVALILFKDTKKIYFFNVINYKNSFTYNPFIKANLRIIKSIKRKFKKIS